MKESHSLTLPHDAYAQGRRASDSSCHIFKYKAHLEKIYNSSIRNKSPAASIRQLHKELVGYPYETLPPHPLLCY